MEKITIIGPCFNEAENIDEFLKRIIKILEKLYLLQEAK